MTRDAIVVGGGLGGLGAASLLAHRGHSVLLLEATPHLGGPLLAGRGPDPAFAVLREGRHSPIAQVFHELGEALPLAPLGAPQAFLYGERERLPENLGSLLRTRVLGFHAAREWWGARRVLLRGGEGLRGQSLLEATGPFGSEDAEAFVAMLAGLHTLVADADRCSAARLAALLRARRRVSPRWALPAGGWGSVIQRLRDRFLAARGSLRVATSVGQVAESPRGFRVATGAGTEEARAVVLAVSPVRAAALAAGLAPKAALSSMRTLQPVTGLRLDARLRRAPLEERALLCMPEPFGLGIVDPDARGGAGLSWFTPLPSHRMEDAGFLDATRHLLRSLLAGLFPGVWSEAFELRIDPVMASGAAPVVGQEWEELPPTGLAPGLFLVGDHTRVEGTVAEAAARSALAAAHGVEAFLEARVAHPKRAA